MFGKLSGYKTYIVAFTTVVSTVAAYLLGDTSLQDGLQLVIPAILGATLRHGVTQK